MKRCLWRHMAVFLLGFFAICMVSGCGILRSSAAENDLILSDESGMEESEGEEELSAGSGDTEESEMADIAQSEDTRIYVYICGQVKEEGVYQMDPDSRVYEVIEEAGGLTEGADVSLINQAARVEDGEKIYIPEIGEGMSPGQNVDLQSAAEDSDGNGGAAGGKVNINTADKDELMTLNGVGESRAESIIRYREEEGRFQNPEDLKNVSGIGDGIFSKIEADICV